MSAYYDTETFSVTFPLADVEGVAVTVLGAARSGVAAARLLASKGATVFVSDAGSEESLSEPLSVLAKDGIPFEAGKHSERVYACDVMVLSPGVPTENPVVQEAIRKGIEVVSELECASWFCKGPIAAITGSNGKTTATTLLGRMLGDARVPHAVGGNIGTAFSGLIPRLTPREISVLEVSSFQLDHIRSFHPTVSVILNITRDHMDRYGNSLERYAAAKARLTMNQDSSDLFLYNADDEQASHIAASARCTVLPFSTERRLSQGAWIENGEIIMTWSGTPQPLIRLEQISIPGLHNASNAMAAALVAGHFGVSAASIRATLRNFKGVEHRLELVRDVRGIRYVNDSKATNVDSVMVALRSFTQPVILMLGGRDKGNDYSQIRDLVRQHVRAIVAIGESADKVVEAFTGVVPVETAASFEGAVSSATALATSGDVVLLSPGCASFDWFRNFEHRGSEFRKLVEAL